MDAGTPGQTINGCYKLQEKVGEDRFFATWRATALYSPNSFSLTFFTFPYKKVPKRAFDEFRRLFLSLYTFQNPYVLTPFEYDESAETKYLASHWIRGYSLREAIDNGDFSEKDQVINTAIHILRGLAELERIGVRHDVLTPKSLLWSSIDSEYDVPRIRNVGFSLFVDALGAAAEYRDLPRYRTDALADGTHERDLYAAGAIIAELVSAVEGTVETGSLSTLSEVAEAFRADTASFTSIADALTYMLTRYPEKRTVDLIQEHVVDAPPDDTMSKDLYRSIEARYQATRASVDEDAYRTVSAEPRSATRDGAHRPGGPSPSVDEPHEEAEDEIVELLPIAPEADERPRGLFARAVSAVRRLFTRRAHTSAAPAAPPDEERRSPPPDTTAGTSETESLPAENTLEGHRDEVSGNGAPVLPQPEPHEPQEVDTSRVLEIFRQLKEHFIRTIRPKTNELRLDRAASQSSATPPWQGALRERSRSRGDAAADSDAQKGAAGSSTSRIPHDTDEKSPDGETGVRENGTEWGVERDGDAEAKDYDFKPGPDYAPGERRGLDDEGGEPMEVDFGSSVVRTDRKAKDHRDEGPDTTSEITAEDAGSEVQRATEGNESDATAPTGTPRVKGGEADRGDVDRTADASKKSADGKGRGRRRASKKVSSRSNGRRGAERHRDTGASQRRPKWFWRLVARVQSTARRIGAAIFRRMK